MKAKLVRARAKKALKGRYWWAVLAALVACMFGVVSIGTGSGVAAQIKEAAKSIKQAIPDLSAVKQIVAIIVSSTGLLISTAMSILSGAVRLGYARYNLNLISDEEKPSMNLVFSRVDIAWKGLLLELIVSVLFVFGTILLIVPGFIALLAYSQSVYLLAEDPDMGVVQALKESRRMMKGHKWRLFRLALSFLGWSILAGIVPGGVLLLVPYMEAADAVFYLELTGRLDKAKAIEASVTGTQADEVGEE